MRWRVVLILPVVTIGCMAVLFCSVMRELVADIERAMVACLLWLIEWANDPAKDAA